MWSLEIPKWCPKRKSSRYYFQRKRHDTHSLFSTPENGNFFEKPEFFSELKQKAVNDSDFQSSFYLYKTLKMKHLGNMDDLYNIQELFYFMKFAKTDFSLWTIGKVLIQESPTQQAP